MNEEEIKKEKKNSRRHSLLKIANKTIGLQKLMTIK